MLPNFFVVGAQKSATTSVHQYLRSHPEIYLPDQKETKFFVHEHFYSKGIRYYEEEYFSRWNGELAVGEVDPDYMYCEAALDRMAHSLSLSSMKLIFLFRDPVHRAFSHYLMMYRRGLEHLSFEDAIIQEPTRIAQGHMENLRYSYVTRGFYLRQVERFLKHIDRGRLLFLLTDDLKQKTASCLRTIYDFLEVNPDFSPPDIHEEYHPATVPRSMVLLRRIKGQSFEKRLIRLLLPKKDLRLRLRQKLVEFNQTTRHRMTLRQETREQLAALFKKENDRLADFLNRDLSSWDFRAKEQSNGTNASQQL